MLHELVQKLADSIVQIGSNAILPIELPITLSNANVGSKHVQLAILGSPLLC